MERVLRLLIAWFPALSRKLLPSLLAIKRFNRAEDRHYRACVDVALREAGIPKPAIRRQLHGLPYTFMAEQIFFQHASVDVLRRVPLSIANRHDIEQAIRSRAGRGLVFGCSNFGCFYYSVAGLAGIVDELLVLSDDPTDEVVRLSRKAGAIAGIKVCVIKADASAGLQVLRQLKRGGAAAVMLDSYYGGATDLVAPFMGRPAVASGGVYVLAAHCAALVIPLALIRNGGGFGMELGQPIDAAALGAGDTCREVNAFFESRVIRHPEQWMCWPNLLARWEMAASPGDSALPTSQQT